VICSTRDEVNDICINRTDGKEGVYEALDTDHHGHPLRQADKQTVLKYRERLCDKLVLKVGARVVLRRNIYIDGGWVNGTPPIVASLHPSCIFIAKLANPAHRYLSLCSDSGLKSVVHPTAYYISNFPFS
jgi:hypothetical protein